MSQQINAEHLFNNTIAISINVEGMGRSRKVSLDNVEVDADKDRLGMSAKILQCPEMDAIKQLFANLRATISDPRRGKALPASMFRRGVYVLPIGAVAETDSLLREYQETLVGLVDALIAVYPQRIAEDRLKLREKFSEVHYPSVSALQETFRIHWRYMSLAPSAQLQTISSAVYQSEVQRVTAEITSLGEEVKATLREAAYALVASLHDKLGMDEAGKPKMFRGASVNNLVQFLSTFETKNIMGDEQLSAILLQMRDVLSGVEPKELRTNEALRTAVRESLGAVVPTLGELVVSAGRKITLPDEEPAAVAPIAVEEPAAEVAPAVEEPTPAPVAGETCKKHRTQPKPCASCKAEADKRRKAKAA